MIRGWIQPVRSRWGLPAQSLPCLIVAASLPGCAPPQQCLDVDALPAGEQVQIIGDSVFDFNEDACEDISDYLSLSLGAQVEDRSVGGTWLDHPEDDDIVTSYQAGPWPWVIVDGGGNDLLGECGCECTAEQVARLSDLSGTTGAMPALVEQIVADGAQVLLFGYYAPTASSEFGGCLDELELLSTGYAAIAARFPEVTFLDGRDLIDASVDRDLLHGDGVHLTGPAAARVAQAMLPIVSQ